MVKFWPVKKEEEQMGGKMAFKLLVGRATKGGSSSQQAATVEKAALDLEAQLNDPVNGVDSIQSVLVHDLNPLDAEIIAFVKTTDAKKKGA